MGFTEIDRSQTDMRNIQRKGFKNPNDANVFMERTENISTKNEINILTPAVSVQDSCKRYGKGPPILNNFTMTVQRGTIYGLLGASGCGKTTILSCIVGLKKLDSGDIKVFGAVPGTKESGIPGKTIGYMPQEIALYQIFTIKEILQYFGRIYGMTPTEIQARMVFLMNFLDLPDCNQRICDLSGGQQRRTSLAVAMVHEPELLILDEPTVGVDPLVRECIWEYLCDIVARRKTTVIITTHYIEEARQSHMIGLMRNGRLLTERPPLALLEEHNATLLEDIVLKLCKKDNLMIAGSNYTDEVNRVLSETSFYSHKELSTVSQNPVLGLSYKSRSPDDLTIRPMRSQLPGWKTSTNIHRNDISSNINIFQAIVIRNMLSLLRYPLFLFIFLLIPAVQIILFNNIIGSDPKNTLIGMVNQEFQSTDYFELCKRNSVGCFNEKLSCNFLNIVPEETIKWVALASEQDALESVARGQTLGYVSIPANFTQDLKERSLLGKYSGNETLKGSEITIRLDMSYNIKGTFIRTQFYKYYLDFIKSIVIECGGDPRTVELPMKYNPIYGTLDGGFIDFMQPGQILLIIFILPMASCLNFVWDKKAGTLDRTAVAGAELYHILWAFIFTEGLMIIIELALCFGVLILFLEYSINGSIILTFLLCLLQGITGLSFGFLFGTFCDHELEAFFCILGIFLPVFISSGSTWPVESVYIWIRPFCDILPATFSTEAIRSIINRGWGITHPNVWHGFVSLICWILICCFLSGVIYRRRKYSG